MSGTETTRVLLLDFIDKRVGWITVDEVKRRMREQEQRGIRLTAERSVPPPKERP